VQTLRHITTVTTHNHDIVDLPTPFLYPPNHRRGLQLDRLDRLGQRHGTINTSAKPGPDRTSSCLAIVGRRKSTSNSNTREPTRAAALAKWRATVVLPSPGAAEATSNVRSSRSTLK